MANPMYYGYLELPYLEEPYLAAYGAQATGMQALIAIARSMGMQGRVVIYNVNRLRILKDFPSRGLDGLTWTASSTATGDFLANNLNTDIVEQVWRSIATVTNITLVCDTQITQGVLVDTLAMLNHNLSSSAVMTLEGSTSPTFVSIGFTTALTWAQRDIFFIAPTFPTTQFRYWRISINDPNNADGYIQIGTILFGTSIIFLQGYADRPTKQKRHFSDKVATEGFTNASNNRALKFAVTLDFPALDYTMSDWANLSTVIDDCRTSLKALWIPDPQKPNRLSVFGKLADMPTETHDDKGLSADNVALTVTVDESL